MDSEQAVSSDAEAPSTTSRRRTRDAANSDMSRTSTACQNCRNKKVKCSGDHPCTYCAKRNIECIFLACEKKKLYSISQIRDLETKVALYESQDKSLHSDQERSEFARLHPATSGSRNQTPDPVAERTSSSLLGLQEPATTVQNEALPVLDSIHTELPKSRRSVDGSASFGTPRRSGYQNHRALAPTSALSSSEIFSSEVKGLLVARHTPLVETPDSIQLTSRQVDRQALRNIRTWPDEEEAHSMLETVVLNVGISQQLFDVRAFSDHLSILYEDADQDMQISRLWLVEVLLVFAIGRLLQTKVSVNTRDFPGTTFFTESMKMLPQLTELRKQGVLGIEVMGLAAQYLQLTDRKDDAYVYSNTALRLAISHGMHRPNDNKKLRRSEIVHRNRLWWTIYMQERRLAAACGHPASISDYAIRIEPPSDFAGFPSSTALTVNVELARISGQITAEIYSHENESETAFIAAVQKILTSLHDVEKKMPAEYSMEVRADQLTIAGRSANEISPQTARTSASLYLVINQGIIYAVRPVLLHLAKYSRDGEGPIVSEIRPTLRRLAEFCVEAARKSLVIVRELRQQGILTKHAFLDLDAIFSAGFVFVLAEVINPDRGSGWTGIDGTRSILKYLADLGNNTAAKRLAEIDQMCAHLSLQTENSPQNSTSSDKPRRAAAMQDFLKQPFSFTQDQSISQMQVANPIPIAEASSGPNNVSDPDLSSRQFVLPSLDADRNGGQDFTFQFTDLSNMSLEGENDLYHMYHTPGFSFTGVDLADWEALERQLSWNFNP